MTQVVSREVKSGRLANHAALLDMIEETHQVVASLKQKTFVVKFGGSTLEYQRAVLQDLIWLHDLGVKVVLVHGGGQLSRLGCRNCTSRPALSRACV